MSKAHGVVGPPASRTKRAPSGGLAWFVDVFVLIFRKPKADIFIPRAACYANFDHDIMHRVLSTMVSEPTFKEFHILMSSIVGMTKECVSIAGFTTCVIKKWMSAP